MDKSRGDRDISHDFSKEYVRERLGDHRDLLKRLSELDTELSDDAARVLEILSESGGQE